MSDVFDAITGNLVHEERRLRLDIVRLAVTLHIEGIIEESDTVLDSATKIAEFISGDFAA